MSLEKWVEYGRLKREPTSPGENKRSYGYCGAQALRIQKLKPYRAISGSSLHSMQLSPLQQLRCGRRVIARSHRPVIEVLPKNWTGR